MRPPARGVNDQAFAIWEEIIVRLREPHDAVLILWKIGGMAHHSSRKDLSLRALELFQAAARKNSLQEVAAETGLSISTVSHHLRNLEEHLGTELFDHSRRPMVLTPRGQIFLRNINEALQAIRKAKAEVSAGNITEAGQLRLGSIEDFDSDILPGLAVFLARHMPRCDFLYHTESSHAVIAMLHDRKLDLGFTTTPAEPLRDLQDTPLLSDPFTVVLPKTCDVPVQDLFEGRGELPFLRYSAAQMMSRQIDSHLQRNGFTLPYRFECASNQTLLAMVAAGAGWAVTTPLHYARARRFQPQLRLETFPGKRFARTLSILSTPDCAASVRDLVHSRMRSLISSHALQPLHEAYPWLASRFTLLP